MSKFILKRLLISFVIFFFVMFIIYALEFSLPTSYVSKMARQLSQKPGNMKSYDEWMADLNAQYGMDKGILGGYFTWLGSMFRLDFGDSWQHTKPVLDVFSDCIWHSFILSAISFVFEIIIAIPLGVVAARKQYSFTDYFVTVVAMVCISMPTFFVATVLKMIFSVRLNIFDIGGMTGRNYHLYEQAGDTLKMLLDRGAHFVLPALTLTIISIGGLMRYTRTNMLEVLNADYIRTARAKGLSERKVINKHAFRNTLIPIVTILGGSLPGLFGGALITETLFDIRGIGWYSYNSMINGDIPFTMFYLAFIAILTLLGNLIADILYAVVDPRVRIS